ncbi:Eukaryotic aspartyl protease family protein [Striga hermonthica]|uniref:Eukaryotic aspartyl protease family protein n=1 Tax=Striga hermonthica TaxID=68872 RepID=A0A9N7MQU6_STRHE|nr:Eukaryotic aspartyl protease family protein [Striga hermonthica]
MEDITSQLSATECSPNIPLGMKNRQSSAVMEVVHRHGPCADESNERKAILSRPSAADILRNDHLRVQSINNRGGDVRSPLISGDSLDAGNYIVTMGLGTPEQKQFLILDTGSGVTWAQCKPCHLGECYSQKGPLFDPSNSSSFSFIPCNSSDCSLVPHGDYQDCSSSDKCIYSVTYGDGSTTTGYLSIDTLTVSPNVAVPDFLFGCSEEAGGLFGRVSGLLGLDRGNVSLVSQTADIFHECFSYCLPSNTSSKGFLALGKDYDDATQFTPLIFKPEHPSFYYIDITSIAVEGSDLPIGPDAFTGSVIIDSGTVISRLPSNVYSSLSNKITEVMTKKYNYSTAPPVEILDTCFFRKEKDVAPSMSFTFQKNVQIHLDASGIFYVVDKSVMCLAFAGNTDIVDFIIFGNSQQKTFEVVYDVANNKLGFRPGMCA